MMGTVEAGRRLIREDHVGCRSTVVLTYVEDGEYETRVDGGPLDGWTTGAADEDVAMANHRWVLRLARSCE